MNIKHLRAYAINDSAHNVRAYEETTANVPDSPVKYPVTKNNPNYLFCNFPWFGLVSIRIKK